MDNKALMCLMQAKLHLQKMISEIKSDREITDYICSRYIASHGYEFISEMDKVRDSTRGKLIERERS